MNNTLGNHYGSPAGPKRSAATMAGRKCGEVWPNGDHRHRV